MENRTSASHHRGSGGLTDARPAFPAAVLWDMDGTLVDTEPYWIAAEHRLADAHGASWSQEHALNLIGNDLLDSGRYIREHMGVDLNPHQIVEILLDDVIEQVRHEVPFRPGARELLADLAREGVPLALVTMSYRRFAEPVLAALDDNYFNVIVTGDEVDRGKPYPDPYLKAAAELGVEPGCCVAIEDSEPGTSSAAAAGCHVLVVPLHGTVTPGVRRTFRDSLLGLTTAGLAELI